MLMHKIEVSAQVTLMIFGVKIHNVFEMAMLLSAVM
jgi:hypothetical protein